MSEVDEGKRGIMVGVLVEPDLDDVIFSDAVGLGESGASAVEKEVI